MIVFNIRLGKSMRLAAAMLTVAVIALLIVSVVVAAGETAEKNADTAEMRLDFLKQYGFDCAGETFKEVVIPDVMPEVYITYNEIQIQQGFNLEDYAGETVALYTYNVLNYPNEDEVLAHLIVKNGCVIGGDIASARLNGFMHGITNYNAPRDIPTGG